MAKMAKAKKGFKQGFALVDGAGASTNIAVTGITTADELQLVLEVATSTNDPTDRTATSSITSNGNIQCTDATTSDKLLVIWACAN